MYEAVVYLYGNMRRMRRYPYPGVQVDVRPPLFQVMPQAPSPAPSSVLSPLNQSLGSQQELIDPLE
jgi:hypothetical protein